MASIDPDWALITGMDKKKQEKQSIDAHHPLLILSIYIDTGDREKASLTEKVE